MRLRHLFPSVRAPEGGEGGGDAVVTPPAGDPPPATGSAEVARPDYLPEKFWDAEAKAPNIEALAKSYGELEAWKGTKADTLKAEILAGLREGVPENADGYALELPKGILPEGFTVAIDPKDPFLADARATMHSLGAKPEQWNDLLGKFVMWQASTMPKPAEELAKLGEGAQERVAAVDAWLAKALPKGEYDALASSLTRAEGVAAIERLMRSRPGSPQVLPGGGGGNAPGGLTPAQAMAHMSHADYHHEVRGREMRSQVAAFVAAGGRVAGYGA